MNVAVIGTGKIGSQVATRLAQGGIDVVVAASSLESAQQGAEKIGNGVTAAEVAAAVEKSEAVVLAVPFPAIQGVVADLGQALVSKVVIDPSNNIRPDEQGRMLDRNEDGRSAGQKVAEWLPAGAHYVKGFGTMSAAQLGQRELESGQKVTLFYAGDDTEAEQTFVDLAHAGGWSAVKAGGVADTRRIEVFGELHPFGQLQDRLLSQDEATELVQG